MKPLFRSFLPMFLAALAAPVLAQTPAQVPSVKIYAQELIDRTIAMYPEIQVAAMHVTPPKSTQNIVIASNIGRLEKLGDDDDMRVINTGVTRVKVGKNGDRISTDIVLRDATGGTLGSLGLVWGYKAGDAPEIYERKAEVVREMLARRILNAANLMDPFPFDKKATTKTRAQKLIDKLQQSSPEVRVLALRGRLGGTGELVLLGSTFGRHGKKADDDDMKILSAKEPKTDVYANGTRFGVDLPLSDAKGTIIGTMNVGYVNSKGNEQALLAKAVALRAEIQRNIVSASWLEELDP